MRVSNNSPFYQQLATAIDNWGGMHNAHLHLDRAGTIDERYITIAQNSILESSHISLHRKHHLINQLHASPAYEHKDFCHRINSFLDIMIACNTRRADTLVDVTADGIGLRALQMMQEIKQQRAQEIDLRIAAYSPFGFRDSEPEMWDVFAKGSSQADFIAALPEADDTSEYPQHIGFDEHLRRTLELAKDKNCIIHIHTDQRNEPNEDGTERLIESVSKYGAPISTTGESMVWAVHMISPSTYDEIRFNDMVAGLKENNIGVICCPSAAIGMRQIRSISTPTYNSIPRVLELLAAGVHIKLASDNIADICSPSTTADLVDEVFMLSAAIRYYHIDILAKLAAGIKITTEDRESIAAHLAQNNHEIDKITSQHD
ncbi:Cytosine deaminase [Zhongshania aliphaticivorans]|uniref:Cytosine deaminase n=1 Tax=Zhongshania aliphaticivorans TaxID=1470434 RepID=A0A5S9PSV5_9GAMM|nr:hypothetical protein [Zhongshania aliphaticivorans]CAA0107177.1 Cytosine deaminase [Zhongshania aliphaticivorans]CAA0107266.1 Cytosine deaminase [Zhongshania aliphaticivorans]